MSRSGHVILILIINSLITLVFLSTVNVAHAEISDGWTNIEWTDDRSEASVIRTNNNMLYVFGGIIGDSSDDVSNTSCVINPTTGIISRLSDMPYGIRGAAIATDQEKIFVFGGKVQDAVPYTQIYDIRTDSWSIGEPMPISMYHSRAAVTSWGIWVIGGMADQAQDFVLIYNYLSGGFDSWSSWDSLPQAVFAGSAFFVDPFIWYVGGFTDGTTATDRVFRINGETSSTWEEMNPLPFAIGGSAGIIGPDGVMYLIGGGTDDSSIANGLKYAFYHIDSSDTWNSLPDLNEPMKYSYAFIEDSGWIWVVAGTTSEGTTFHGEKLEVARSTVELSSAEVGQGDSLVFRLTVELRYGDVDWLTAPLYIRSSSGSIYNVTTLSGWQDINTTSLGGVITVPDDAEMGAWDLVIPWIELNFNGRSTRLTVEPMSYTVVDSLTVKQRIDNIENAIHILEDGNDENLTAIDIQLSILQDQLDDLKNDRDDAMSANTGTVLMILVCISIALGVTNLVILMRRK